MSEHDAKLYEQFLSKVSKQISSIQLMLNNVQVLVYFISVHIHDECIV